MLYISHMKSLMVHITPGGTNFVPLPKKKVGCDVSGFGQAKIGPGQVKPGMSCCQHDTMAAWDCLSPL